MKKSLPVLLLFVLINLLYSQNYVGSNTCTNCHNYVRPSLGFNIWTEFNKSGHPYKLNQINGAPPVYPQNTTPGVPAPPPGKTWNDFVYVIGGYGWKARFLASTGLVYTTDSSAQYNLETQGWVPYEYGKTVKYNYNCFKCHTTGPSATGSWNGNPADSLGTFSEPGIRCEGCHGPGSDHAANPTIKPPVQGNSLKIDRCGDCHQRGGTTNSIPAGGGYIQHHEQINEMRASKHGDGQGVDLTCATCHEVHLPLRYKNATSFEPIKQKCQDCHTGHQILLNGQPKPIDCVDCHMAPATKSAVGKVVGNGRRGDVKTHIFGINTSAVNYTQMFTPDGSKVKLDANGLAAVTLDFACLRCHTNKDLTWAASYADSIHIKGITTGIDDRNNLPKDFVLEQNYPNPFNPITTINFSLPKSSRVKLVVYTINGEYVTTLIDEFIPAGNHSIKFDAEGLSSGTYIYKFTADNFTSSKKMILLK